MYRHFTIVWPRIETDSLWIKPTDALNYNFIGITTPHVSGNLSANHQEFLAVHRLWYILCSCDRLLHKMYQSWCTAKNSWWWAERLPETCRVVIPIKLEFSAYVGFTHQVYTLIYYFMSVSGKRYEVHTWLIMFEREWKHQNSIVKSSAVISQEAINFTWCLKTIILDLYIFSAS